MQDAARTLETGRYENVSRWYLAINPHGTVPMLIHNGQRLFESHVQIAYAASHAPEGQRIEGQHRARIKRRSEVELRLPDEGQ